MGTLLSAWTHGNVQHGRSHAAPRTPGRKKRKAHTRSGRNNAFPPEGNRGLHRGQSRYRIPLYDKPYADNKKVRVAGPFTVESLSPHRVLAVDENDELIDPG